MFCKKTILLKSGFFCLTFIYMFDLFIVNSVSCLSCVNQEQKPFVKSFLKKQFLLSDFSSTSSIIM